MVSACAAFSHMTRTLCMWATIAAMVRPLPSGALAFHASAGKFSIKYWQMRLLVSKAFSKATGSSAENAWSGDGARASDLFGMSLILCSGLQFGTRTIDLQDSL